ncbi:DUF1127 domain-containing protein [Pontivivens ytuae]|uniref:DUF1127 domain-containing protein n=1 Tax=Pontivivens ytuae TaxID=2789856 RepID=A0A7S9LP34_9RHOB|nr:DUF1127 domain-containing protein [Pontivivens ytuae]QPH52681.1 DUF1127 domain-containing protein [Pontivivens ytuae]
MAFVTSTDIRGTSFADRVRAFWAERVEAFEKRRLFNRTVSELDALTSAELNDLGLSRANIRSVAYEAVYGK